MTCHIPAAPPAPDAMHGAAPDREPYRWAEIARAAFGGRSPGERQPLQSLFDHIEGKSWN